MERERGKKLRRCGLPPVRKSTLPWWMVRWGMREKNETQERARTHALTHTREHVGLERPERIWSGETCHAPTVGGRIRASYLSLEGERVRSFSFFCISKVSMQILFFFLFFFLFAETIGETKTKERLVSSSKCC